MGKYVSKIHASLVNPVILPEIVQMPVALAIFVNSLDMVMDDLDLMLDLKDKEEWVRPILIMIFMTMMKRIILLDIKENMVVDLKDMDQVDLAVDLKDVDKDNGGLVADLKDNEAIFEMISILQAIKIIQFWKMYA